MNKYWVVVIAASAALSWGRVEAAVDDELAEIRSQLQTLIQRVDKLEQENAALKVQNRALQAHDGEMKAEARERDDELSVPAAGVAPGKSVAWVDRIAVSGDLRYRYEYTGDETLDPLGESAADRYRHRIHALLNLNAKVTDTLSVGIGFATTENGDPRSSNQSLDGMFSRKSFDLDLAYFDWQFADWGHLIGGKMRQPFVLPGQSRFWDSDVNPEGLAVNLNHGIWFGTAYSFWVDEVNGSQGERTSDVMLYGSQFGVKLPLGASSLTLAAHYYDLSGGVGRAPFYANRSNGNTTVRVGGADVLLYDYEVLNLMAEFNTMIGQTPLQVWIDGARNRDPGDHDTAWATGILFGKARTPKAWEIGASYQKIEKDALFAQFIDADFAGGITDGEGWVLSGGFVPVRNWLLNATLFLNDRNADIGSRSDYERLQVNFNVKF